MSHTDKDAPWKVREARGEEIFRHSSWREKGSGPKGVRFAKREANKARRKTLYPRPFKAKSLTQTYVYNSG